MIPLHFFYTKKVKNHGITFDFQKNTQKFHIHICTSQKMITFGES